MSLKIPHEALKQSPLFSSLSDEQMERVCQHANIVELKPGQPLFTQGDNVNYFYLVASGSVKLFRLSPEGQEKIIEIVSEGQTFAEALMFMDQPHYPVSATALSETEVISIDASDFKSMLHDSVDTCFLLLGDMSSRLRGLIYEIETLSLHTGTCRVASYVLEHAPDDKDTFNLNIAKSVIAARLSVKPETFSRILKDLHGRGILTVEGSQITLHDRQALIAISII